MRITLQRLSLKNFKGIHDLTIEFDPKNNGIYAMNGGGKTTVLDAVTWILYDKDSSNRKDFDIKPLDANNQVVHGLSPDVEVVLLVDGRPLTLRKVYNEKWVKNRGSATKVFDGHETKYYVDGVPCGLKEYKAAVSRITDEDVFKQLTSPTYFNTVFDWKKRRQLLLEVCGDISDEDVIAGNKKLADLPSILNGRSIEDHRKVIAAKRREINEELERIPVRIDEANRSIPDLTGIDEALLDTEIQGLRVTIDQKSAELIKIQNGVQTAELEKRLREIDSEVLDIRNQARKVAMGVTEAQSRRVHSLQSEVYRLQDDVKRAQMELSNWAKVIADKRMEADQLRAKWNELNKVALELDISTHCPTCKQDLPAEQVQAAWEKAEADFNREKSEQMERIAVQGRAAMAEVSRLELESQKCQAYIAEHNDAIQKLQAELATATAELTRLESESTASTNNTELEAKLQEYERVSADLIQIRQSSQATVQTIQSGIASLRSQLAQKEQEKAKFAQVAATDKRISELKEQERTLAAEAEKLEQQLYLTEQFIRTKVSMLEDKINSKFKYARFKLFKQLVNGALDEVCTTTYNGVPYDSGLNNAARIQVGIDIINTLSEHYGLCLPLFIDNRESVSDIPDTDSQVINLIVSPKDKTLRVETGMKEAM